MGEEDGNYVKSVSASSMIVVSNRLPFILRRNEQTGRLERKARYVKLPLFMLVLLIIFYFKYYSQFL